MAGVSLLATTSCSDFLNTAPYDALAPSNTWKTEGDAEKFLIGCYDGWIDESGILYWDCASDFGYSNFLWDHYPAQVIDTAHDSSCFHLAHASCGFVSLTQLVSAGPGRIYRNLHGFVFQSLSGLLSLNRTSLRRQP